MNSSFKYMYFLAICSLQVISLYFYCLCLATGKSRLSGLIFPYLLSLLLDLPVSVYWVFPAAFLLWNPDCLLKVHCFWWTTRETQVVSDSNMPKFLPAHFMGYYGFKATVLCRICHFEKLGHTCAMGLDFLRVYRFFAIHALMTGTLDQFCRWDLKSLDSPSFSAEILQSAVSPNTEWRSWEPQEHQLLISGALSCETDSQQPSSELLCCLSDLLILLQVEGKDETVNIGGF